MLKMQFTVWNATQRLNGIKDNNVYNEIKKRLFNKVFFFFFYGDGKERRIFTLLVILWCFHGQKPSNSVLWLARCEKEYFRFLLIQFTFPCTGVVAGVHICTLSGGQGRALSPWELELGMAGGHQLGTGNRTCVLWKGG